MALYNHLKQFINIYHSEPGSESLNFGSFCKVQDDENAFPRHLERGIKGEGLSHSKKAAFTLAEVLITLGIIGVVAAMTIPTLVSEFSAKILEVRYKKSVSIISEAILRAKSDWGLNNFTQYCTYFSYGAYVHNEECYEILYKNLLNASGLKNYNDNPKRISRSKDTIKTYNSKQIVTESNALAGMGYSILTTNVMPDGSYINYTIIEHRLYIGVDTNGAGKPNKLGHDIFLFQTDRKTDAIIAGTTKPKELTEEELQKYEPGFQQERAGNPCSINSNQKANGIGCAYYALQNKCPYDSTKKYFECLP